MTHFLGDNIKSFDDVLHLFGEHMPNGVWLSREFFGLKSLEFLPHDGSPLQEPRRSTVKLVCDYQMGPLTLVRHCWQLTELDFAKRVCLGSEPITLVDIGANMGLFSRQLLIALPAISKCFAYEPERENFRCLTHNLLPFADRVDAIEAAASDKAGDADFYLDSHNAGNYSFAIEAMPKRHRKTTVKLINVSGEMARWLGAGSRIFYKSDTQGFDEWITTLVSTEAWTKIFAGLIELWRIPGKPPLDTAAFAAILDRYPNKIFLGNPDTKTQERPCTTSDVLNFLAEAPDDKHCDLAFWH